MLEPKDRLRIAREEAGYASPSDAARKLKAKGVNINTLTSAENGNRLLSKKSAALFANAFNVSPSWLLFGTSDGEAKTLEIPILSEVSAGSLVSYTLDKFNGLTIAQGGLPNGDYFALKVDGTSMNRIAPSGALIIVDRKRIALKDKAFYIFDHLGETTFKRFLKDPNRLEPYSTRTSHKTIFPDVEPVPIGEVVRVILDL